MTASEDTVPEPLPRGESSMTVASLNSMQGSHSQEPLVACNGNQWNTGLKKSDKLSAPSTDPVPLTSLNTSSQEDSNPSELDDSGGQCGWLCFKPTCIQRFRSPRWILFWLCWAGALQGLIVNGFVNVVITTIERRYLLSSTESGLIAGGYDIASFLCLIPVSYFGATRRKPLFVGCGVLILALGSLVFSLPHFLAGPNAHSRELEGTCRNANSTDFCDVDSPDAGRSHLSNYLYVFLLGQLLHGVGASPFYTLGCTYLDENVSTKMSSVYIGIYYTMAVFGPALGYILGGQFLKIYTDIGVDTDRLGLTPSSTVWVGAWWIGFVLAAGIGLLVAIPLAGFPKILPGALKVQAEKVSEMHQKLKDSEAVQSGFGTTLRDLPASFKYLLCNPTFVFLSLAGASEGMLVSGLATFMPKIIESQFSIAASSAALLVGLVTVPGAGGGTFFGGYMVKKFQLRCAGIIRMCIVFSAICLCFGLVFIISCENANFFGLNYHPQNRSFHNESDFWSDCNDGCNCSAFHYDPICGTDNVLYYSPCFAGCRGMESSAGVNIYNDCQCIDSPGKNMTNHLDQTVISQATRDKCSNSCGQLGGFLTLIFLCMLFTFLVSMPSLSATLRCVADSQKSFALGIQWITVRLLGTIPAPIIFGKLIDLSCLRWQTSCNSSDGACIFYDNQVMNRNTLILACLLKSLSTVFFISAYTLYKAPKMEDDLDSPKTPDVPNGIPSNGNRTNSENKVV